MLTAYLDESSDGRVFAVAGFMASDEKWAMLSPEWSTLLTAKPKISHFKMHDLASPKANGVFRNYPMQQRIDKTEALIAVINKHLATKADLAVNVVMDVRAFKSILEPVLPDQYKNPYLWCFQGVLISSAGWVREMAPGEKVNFVFDDNKKEFRDALRLYQGAADRQGFVEFKDFVGTIEPGDDKTVMPLQAADLLAGQTRLWGTDKSAAIFIPSISRSDRSHFSYLLGKNKLMAIRKRIESTVGWAQEFMRPSS